jgi:mannose-6-phosphate isomerase-like protein (cupin superfamily)
LTHSKSRSTPNWPRGREAVNRMLRNCGLGYRVLHPEEQTLLAPTRRSERAPTTDSRTALYANLHHSQANLWLYPPGAGRRRHREPLQEEVFRIVVGTLTIWLGEPAERFELRRVPVTRQPPNARRATPTHREGDRHRSRAQSPPAQTQRPPKPQRTVAPNSLQASHEQPARGCASASVEPQTRSRVRKMAASY